MSKTWQETIIGFDSAWADRVPGAICSLSIRDDQPIHFQPPTLTRFQEAATFIQRAKERAQFALVALDQPTLVPNENGMRPVERVAGSIVNGLGGAVQPANRSKTPVFGHAAPLWQFLDQLQARENPRECKSATSGLFLIEVFPALALPAIIPRIWQRKRAARYNPANPKFSQQDWRLVTEGIAECARVAQLPPVANYADELAELPQPKKSDQDKLDSIICLLIAWTWRHGPESSAMAIGDGVSGYIVTPVSPKTRERIKASAVHKNVPFDALWSEDASRDHHPRPLPFTERLQVKSSLQRKSHHTPEPQASKICPECGHVFRGAGWGGIDAHWKALHLGIMAYEIAWPIIRQGGTPSQHASIATNDSKGFSPQN